MSDTVERIVGPEGPENVATPLFDVWKDWNDAMLFVDGYGATIESGRATHIRDATKAGAGFPETGLSSTATVSEAFGRKVLTTVGVNDANARGYLVPTKLLEFGTGFTWGLIFRRETGVTNGTLFSIRDGSSGNGLFVVQQYQAGDRVRVVNRHRSQSDTGATAEATSTVTAGTWNAFRGTVDWTAMSAAHRRIYPSLGSVGAADIPTSGESGAPDWTGKTVRVLDKIYTAGVTGRFYGQLGAFVMMKGVLTGEDLTDFDNRLIALAGAIDV